MKHREEKLFIEDILRFCDQIAEYIQSTSKSQFLDNIMLQDALARKLELIGEAVKNIFTATRRKHPIVPWKDIAGMRDKLIHHYFSVDLEVVWKTSTKFVPELKPAISKVLESKAG